MLLEAIIIKLQNHLLQFYAIDALRRITFAESASSDERKAT